MDRVADRVARHVGHRPDRRTVDRVRGQPVAGAGAAVGGVVARAMAAVTATSSERNDRGGVTADTLVCEGRRERSVAAERQRCLAAGN